MKRIAVLGASGSIGIQALEILAGMEEHFQTVLLCANRAGKTIAKWAEILQPEAVAFASLEGKDSFLKGFKGKRMPEIFSGPGSVEKAIRSVRAHVVLNGITGSAGLGPTIAAIETGATLALANKESLVMAGSLVKEKLERHGSKIIPVDSEHSAIFQCLKGVGDTGKVRRVYLTASGGAARDVPAEKLDSLTPREVLPIRTGKWERESQSVPRQ